MKRRRAAPTSEEVIQKLKDDGDFDALRVSIVRKVKQNEDLRNTIITEVKQSIVVNTDGSELLKPGQISDAVYEELGIKLMGQISDEVWKVIRSSDIKSDIRGTVESVYTRIVNPEERKEEPIPSSPAKVQLNGEKEDGVPPVAVSSNEVNVHSDSDLEEPPGFARSVQQTNNNNKEDEDEEPPGFGLPKIEEPPGFAKSAQRTSKNIKVEYMEPDCDEQPCLPSNGVLHEPLPPDVNSLSDDLSPGYGGMPVTSSAIGHHRFTVLDSSSDEDPDVPPGFG